ncbi:hypothetical protein QJS04_geneDACA000841 [Acorus gramineus]|uniref:Uncharacterized protein n=1 Tax=Acorus gramineus TaxID=55184 RepID=A0AAV9BG29_ACOGR|nr:hypothetical protein QJS04_geneDACA000841 [Acorus gramineus]
MLQAVLTNLLLFYLSVFSISTGVLDRIDRIRRRFLWQGGEGDWRVPHLVDCDSVCSPKRVGGLGVLDLWVMNMALLAKWAWRWLCQSKSLWCQVMRDRYGVVDIGELRWPRLNAQALNAQATQLSKGIFAVRQEMEEAIEWKQGDGASTHFWSDKWCGGESPREMAPTIFSLACRKDGAVREFAQDDRT